MLGVVFGPAYSPFQQLSQSSVRVEDTAEGPQGQGQGTGLGVQGAGLPGGPKRCVNYGLCVSQHIRQEVNPSAPWECLRTLTDM